MERESVGLWSPSQSELSESRIFSIFFYQDPALVGQEEKLVDSTLIEIMRSRLLLFHVHFLGEELVTR